MSEREDHWQGVYSTKGEDEVSWFEESPAFSLGLLDAAGLRQEHALVDIGGGASRLVDALIARGQAWVSVLDLSQAALDIARARLPEVSNVGWIAGDVTQWEPDRGYDFWHDRAALHFLATADDQARYAEAIDRALVAGGVAVIGTFAPDGPEKCSGLPVVRHDGESLSALLGDRFVLVGQVRHEHVTPWGSVQKFQFSTFRKRQSEA
ncbi:SAM-dependent methyltransferase [Devosia subaequoris]|uniref:SAM-dependent methyltransferase n=1 Tax=Devosia subaequoris TaxID=395930 RepID=A0A7W6NBJ2_9HYPH|nr:SAM-dependent methyltransferase [Devosia subaequoris]MCP1209785.1 class I SAM-dependent methyltransferase [Devosia subaequoris]